MKKLTAGLLVAASATVLVGTGVGQAVAKASPGQCITSPWGGFCDGLPLNRDGVFQHCEGAMGFQNCFLVRPVPVEIDPRGWVPA